MDSGTKVLFFDIDGTIMTFSYTIPESTVCAIQRARADGNICIICSGRPVAHVDPQVRAIGFDGFVCSCGMHVVLGEKDLFHASATPEITRKTIALARASDSDVIYENEDGMFFDRTRPLNDYMRTSRDHFGGVGLNVDGDIDAPDYAFDKIFCWTRPENSNCGEFLDFLNENFHVIGRGEETFEVVAPGCSKRTGMEKMLCALDLPWENTYAFGDGLNDLDMLDFAGHSIAMGNGRSEVKERADYITADIEEDGLALAMEHFDLI